MFERSFNDDLSEENDKKGKRRSSAAVYRYDDELGDYGAF